MAHLIVGGVFERHPTLQAVWTEFWGLRWAIEDLAHMTDRLRDIHPRYLDDTHSLRRHHTFGSPVVDGLSLTPLEYFQRNCSIGASLLPRHDVKYAEVLGIERIMWGTDFPHDEGSAPNTTAALRATMHDQPTNVLRAMLGANAARLYDFDIEALKPIAARIGPRVDEVSEPLEVWPQRPSAVFLRQSPLEKALSN